jgi:hypothetical protein
MRCSVKHNRNFSTDHVGRLSPSESNRQRGAEVAARVAIEREQRGRSGHLPRDLTEEGSVGQPDAAVIGWVHGVLPTGMVLGGVDLVSADDFAVEDARLPHNVVIELVEPQRGIGEVGLRLGAGWSWMSRASWAHYLFLLLRWKVFQLTVNVLHLSCGRCRPALISRVCC